MTRSTKWIKEVSPDQPASKVARVALKRRLDVVADYLPQAAKHADEDIEHVHQLRVATRRAIAAIRVFEDQLPRRRTRQMKQILRRVRQTAGNARDLDVLYHRLESHVAQSSDSGMQHDIR